MEMKECLNSGRDKEKERFLCALDVIEESWGLLQRWRRPPSQTRSAPIRKNANQFIFCRKLRKPRVTRIHMNLFASMILQCLVRLVIYVDQMVVRQQQNSESASGRPVSAALQSQESSKQVWGIDNTVSARAQYNKKLWCNSGQYWLKRLFIATESLESSNNLFSPFFVSFSTRWLNTAKPPCFCGCSLRASYFITWPLCLTLGAQSIKRSFTSVGGVSAAKKWN